jgi:hypothetical protein
MGGDSSFGTVNVSGKTYQMGDLGSLVLPPLDPKDRCEIVLWSAALLFTFSMGDLVPPFLDPKDM